MGHTTLKRWLGVVGTGVVLGLLVVAYLNVVGSQQPRAITCLGNTKLTGVGLLMYAQDHDGVFPPGEVWLDGVLSVADYPEKCCCLWARKEDPGAYGIALNFKLVQASLVDVASPEEVPMVFECPNAERNAVSSFHLFRLPWHPNRMAVTYADGHAVKLQPKGVR